MYLNLQFDGLKMRFRINSFRNNLLFECDDYGWTRINFSIHSRDLRYKVINKEVLEDREIERIFVIFERLLSQELTEETMLGFTEPDYALYCYPAHPRKSFNPNYELPPERRDIIPLIVKWVIRLRDGWPFVTGHQIQIDLRIDEIIALYYYLGYALEQFTLDTPEIRQFIKKGIFIPEAEDEIA